LRDAPVIRDTARIEVPSTNAPMICARLAASNFYIRTLCLSGEE
jgi:hypothetical protein